MLGFTELISNGANFINELLGQVGGGTTDPYDTAINYLLTSLFFIVAYFVSKGQKANTDYYLHKGLFTGFIRGTVLCAATITSIWFIGNTYLQHLFYVIIPPIDEFLHLLTILFVSTYYVCYLERSHDCINRQKKCAKAYMKESVCFASVIYILSMFFWLGTLDFSYHFTSPKGIVPMVWHVTNIGLLTYPIIRILRVENTWARSLFVWSLGSWFMYDLISLIPIDTILLPLRNILYLFTVPIVVYTHIKQQSDKLEYAKNQAKLLASDRSFIIKGFTHEIRTPLIAISSFIESLSMMNPKMSDEEIQEIGKKCPKDLLCNHIIEDIFPDMREAVKHISNVLDNLSSFGENSSRHRKDLYDIISLTKIGIKYAKFTDEAKMIESSNITYDSPTTGEVKVLLTPSKYIQILQNLLRNSVRAVYEAKREAPDINVSLQLNRGYCTICVYDNGIGMTDGEKEHCLEKYWTRYKDRGGTGLGLYLVHTYVKEFGGNMSVESVLGEYTKIYINFPLP